MKCPFCLSIDTKVMDSRTVDDNAAIRRRRICEKCGERFTTYERAEITSLMVIKRDRSREPFDRTKLMNGILKSIHKRPVSMENIEAIVDEIENACFNSSIKEIESMAIGEMVMAKLKSVDEVAYVRFASVYRHFKDIESFMNELTRLQHEKGV